MDNQQQYPLSDQQKYLKRQSLDLSINRLEIALAHGCDLDALSAKINQVLTQHEVLNSEIVEVPGLRYGASCRGSAPQANVDLTALKNQPESSFHYSQLTIALSADEQDSLRLCFSAPAITIDSLSLSKLWQQVNQGLNDEELTQYDDFASWQQDLEQSEEGPEALEYWQALQYAPIHNGFDDHHNLPQQQPIQPSQQVITIESQETETLLTAWFALQYLMNDDDKARVNVMFDSRLVYEELETAIGPYSQFLPVQVQLRDDTTSQGLTGLIEQQIEDHYQWLEFSPLATVKTPQDLLWAFEQIQTDESAEQRHISDHCAQQHQGIKLSVLVQPQRTTLSLSINHPSLPSDFHHNLLKRYVQLVNTITANPNQAVSQLTLTLAEDNDALTDNPAPTTVTPIVTAIEQACDNYPQHNAVVYQQQTLNYQQLKQQADQFAQYLLSQQLPAQAPVILALDRSVAMVVALVGCLKAGHPFVPIDPEQNQARLSTLLNQLEAPILLAHQPQLFSEIFNGQIIAVDNQQQLILPQLDLANELTLPAVEPQQLAYIIYTSGSTGVPKGVAISHQNLSHYVSAVSDRLGLAAKWQYASVSTLTADLGHTALFGALANGGCIHLIDFITATNGSDFADYVQQHQIDVLKIVPSHLQALRASCAEPSQLLPNQVLVLGGESFTPNLAEQLDHDRKASNKSVKLFNHYGPTEATVGCFVHSLDTHGWHQQAVPIGTILGNNQQLITAAPGCIGELLISGPSVSPGYYQDPDNTAKSFIEIDGKQYYRTGDKVRLNNLGAVEYIGRIDNQVKLRGYRVELGAIRQQLLNQQGVIDAQVLADDQQLTAYVVSQDSQHQDPSYLNSKLAEQLPSYMLPSDYLFLAQLPLTANGKLDRSKLPSKQQQLSELTTDTEKRLAEIWLQLLTVDKVGGNSNFFTLGGHSLLATQQVFHIQQQFQVNIALGEIFDHPTLADLAAAIDQLLTADSNISTPTAQPVNITPVSDDTAPTPLSFAQQRLWFLQQLAPQSAFYNVPATLTFHGPLQLDALNQAFNDLAKQHQLLNSRFIEQDGQVMQQYDATAITINTVDCQNLSLEQIEQDMDNKTNQAFDLFNQAPLKLYLYQHHSEHHQLLVIMHHIICDGLSRDILIEQLTQAYQARLQQQTPDWPPAQLQYRDYASWQHQHGEQLYQTQIDYWQQHLGDDHQPLALNSDHPRPIQPSYQGGSFSFDIPMEQVTPLCQRYQCTPFVAMLALWHALLYRYSNQSQIRVGMPISGRDNPQLTPIVGLLANTLVTQSKPNAELSFSQLVNQLKQDTRQAFDHQTLPFEQLVNALAVPRSTNHSPLFQAFFSLQPAKASELQLGELSIELSASPVAASKFDISLLLNQHDDKLKANIEFDSDLFERASIQQMAQSLTTLLQQVNLHAEQPLIELPLVQVPAASQSPNTAPCLLQRFEQQVAQNPQATAVVFNDEHISYHELNEQISQLCQQLPQRSRVVLALERSPQVLVAMLATLKQQGCFIPLDPKMPQQRQQHIQTQSQPHVVIDHNGVKVVANSSSIETTQGYILYTSGSTGQPKGVEVSLTALNNHLQAMELACQFNSEDIWLGRTTIGFDISLLELFMPLYTGGQLVLAANNDPEQLIALIDNQPINVIQATPGAWHQLLDCQWQPNRSTTLLCGGEALTQDLAAQLLNIGVNTAIDTRLFNVYGPTEATIWATIKHITSADDVNLGKALNNYQCYVLNHAQQLQPQGVIGQLAIAGDSLAQGYFDQPQLTAAQFIDNPFAANDNSKLYLTGDLASVNHRGELQYHGRGDSQIKWRGYRIELGEIVHSAEQLDGISAAYCILRQQQLICYYVAATPIDQALKQHLAAQLPHYMQPSFVMQLSELPLNISGKVDVNALPQVTITRHETVAPANAKEQAIIDIWQQLLGIDNIGPEDNFFTLGGHSLLLTKLMVALRQQTSLEVPLYQLMQADTPRKQAQLQSSANIELPTSSDLTQPQPLSFTQQRLHFLHKLNNSSNKGSNSGYNVPIELEKAENIDKDALKQQLDQLLSQHSQLRSYFIDSDEGPRQIIDNEAAIDIIDCDDVTQFSAIKQHQFALDQAPLLKVAVCGNRLLLVFHHIIVDGWSLNLIMKQLSEKSDSEKSESKKANSKTTEPKNQPQYVDFANWQQQQASDNQWQSQLDYWQQYLQGELPQLNLPLDLPRPAMQSFNGSKLTQTLSSQQQQQLAQLAKQHSATPFQLMLAFYTMMLGRFANQNEILVGTPIANRHIQGSENIVGLFANTQVYRCQLQPQQSFAQLINQIKQDGIAAQQHQDLPFEQIVDALALPRDTSITPIFQAMLVVQNWQQPTTHKWQVVKSQQPSAKFDITLVADDYQQLSLEYNRDLFAEHSISNMLDSLIAIIEQVCQQPDAESLSQYYQLPAQQQQILTQWNDTAHNYRLDSTIISDILRCGETYADKTALRFEQSSLSYQQLMTRSQQLASIVALAPASNINALLLPRSLSLIVAILATLRQGQAYLPLGIDLPAERQAYMLNDAKVGVLIAHSSLQSQVTELIALSEQNYQQAPQVIYIDDDFSQLDSLPLEQWQQLQPAEVAPQDLAYVMYTSGSTGVPKGVEVPHIGLKNRLCWQQQYLKLTLEETVLHKTPYNFDVSVWELLWPISQGATMEIAAPQLHQDPQALAQLCQAQAVNVMHFVPSMLQVFIDSLTIELPQLRAIVCSGEALPANLAALCLEKLPQVQLHNLYGPTEASIDVSYYHYQAGDNSAGVPIGKPIDNITLNIFDAEHQLLPIGAIGQLYLSGVGLAKGYLGQPELTAEKFITIDGVRYYQSGDLARWRHDGQLEYIGRVDNQIKLRGQRIELSEIENQLLQHPAIEQAVVLALPADKPERLNAYITCHNSDISEQMLLQDLAQQLPQYMLPNQLVVLDQLALNANGKVDRKQLAQIEIAPQQFKRQPKTKIEQKLCQLLAEQLNQTDVSLDDDIFALGGHSLYLVKLQQSLKHQFDVELNLSQLFGARQVGQLAELLTANDNFSTSALVSFTTSSHTNQQPIFAFHPGSGLSNQYQALAAGVSEQFELIGINATTAIETGQYQHSIEQMAQQYLQQILDHQVDGPYYLIGWSLGAHLALAVAHQLEQMGKHVAWLGWVDAYVTPPNANTENSSEFDSERWQHLLPQGFAQQQAQNILALIKQSNQLVTACNSADYQLNAPVNIYWSEQTVQVLSASHFEQVQQQAHNINPTANQQATIAASHQQIVEHQDFINQVAARLSQSLEVLT